MDAGLFPTLFSLGLLGGFLSGLLGIGGGIIMVPLLLYVPSALGVGTLSMKTVAGITSVQSLFGALSGAIGHKRYNRISMPLAYAVGGSATAGSLTGSIASVYLTSEILLMVFAAMAIVAAVMMVLPRHENGPEPDVESLQFNKPLAVVIGLGIGLLSGIIGQGGAFLLVPAMLYILRIPTRITIGTTLAVGIASSAAVLVGRLGSAAIDLSVYLRLLEEFGEHRIYFKPEASPLGPNLSKLRDATQGKARIFEGSGGINLVDCYRRGIAGTMPGTDLLDGIVALWKALQAGDDERTYLLSLPICALVALQLQGGLDGFLAIEKYLMKKRGIFINTKQIQPVGWQLDSETQAEVDRLFARLQAVI